MSFSSLFVSLSLALLYPLHKTLNYVPDFELYQTLNIGLSFKKKKKLTQFKPPSCAIDREKHTHAQKKLYKKHHKIRGIFVAALPHKEYLKMSYKYTTKAMFTSLCSNYEGNKKVREAKTTMLVHQYKLFRMKDDESLEDMYSRFQNLVYGLQILKKSYVAYLLDGDLKLLQLRKLRI